MTTLWDGAGNVVRTDGTFTGTQVWQNKRDSADATITAQGHDTHDEGLADSIEDCLNRNGENAMAANIAAGGNKFTGVGDAAARDQWLAAGQYQDGEVNWVDSGGTVDAITATYTPNVTALVDGMLLGFRATGANTSTTPTFKAGTTTAHTITTEGGNALVAGDIAGDGHELLLRYNSTATAWELLNPFRQTAAAASDTAAGIVELATTAETTTGTDTTRAVTPDGLHDMTSLAGAAWFLDEDAMTSNSATQVASQQSIKAYVDAAIAALSTPPATFTSTDQTITAGGTLTIAHGLAGVPQHLIAELVCQSSENGYTAGDVVQVNPNLGTLVTAVARGFACVKDATNLNIRYGSDSNTFNLINFSSGALASATNANWKLRLTAVYYS